MGLCNIRFRALWSGLLFQFINVPQIHHKSRKVGYDASMSIYNSVITNTDFQSCKRHLWDFLDSTESTHILRVKMTPTHGIVVQVGRNGSGNRRRVYGTMVFDQFPTINDFTAFFGWVESYVTR